MKKQAAARKGGELFEDAQNCHYASSVTLSVKSGIYDRAVASYVGEFSNVQSMPSVANRTQWISKYLVLISPRRDID